MTAELPTRVPRDAVPTLEPAPGGGAVDPSPAGGAGGAGEGPRRAGVAAALTWLPVGLALLAEAAWVAVLAGLAEALVLHAPVTGVPELLLAALAGLVAARRLAVRAGRRWPWIGGALAGVVGVAGWLASGEVLARLASDGLAGLPGALALNPGGFLAALAFVRGAAHARLPVDPGRIGLVLASVVPGLALAAVVGGMIADPARSAFLASAAPLVVLFLVAALVAQAIARLADIGRGVPVDWRRNPAWLGLVVLLVGITAGVSVLVAAYAGNAIATVLAAVAGPMLLVGFVVGFDRRSIRLVAMALGGVVIVGGLLRVLSVGAGLTRGGQGSTAPTVVVPESSDPGVASGVAVVTAALVLAVLGGLVVARYWLRRPRGVATADDEVREIDRAAPPSAGRRRAPRLGRLRGRPHPADAVAAYRALLAELEGRPAVGRDPAETPAEHARRLRDAGHGDLSLELLAADYGLARFGGLELTGREHRRAVGRYERLRARLRAVEAAQASAGVPAAARPTAARAGAPASAADPTIGAKRGGRRAAGPGADLPDSEQPGALEALLARVRRGP